MGAGHRRHLPAHRPRSCGRGREAGRADGLHGGHRLASPTCSATSSARPSLSGELLGAAEEVRRARSSRCTCTRTASWASTWRRWTRDTALVVLSDHGFELGRHPGRPEQDARHAPRERALPQRWRASLYLYGRGVKARAPLDAAEDGRRRAHGAGAGRPARRARHAGAGARGGARRRDPGTGGRHLRDGRRGATQRGAGRAGPTPRSSSGCGAWATSAAHRAAGSSASAAPGLRSPTGERNIAALHFEAGRYKEAAQAYRAAARGRPEGRLAAHEPGRHARRAWADTTRRPNTSSWPSKLDPLNVEAYHNRAVIYERQGKKDAGRSRSTGRPCATTRSTSRRAQALVRLVGSADVQRAAHRAGEEGLRARPAGRARPPGAATIRRRWPQLAEAEKVAPRYALVYQYRSNVAYLIGRRAPARSARWRRALAIEPDNALFRTNLKRLKQSNARGGREPHGT